MVRGAWPRSRRWRKVVSTTLVGLLLSLPFQGAVVPPAHAAPLTVGCGTTAAADLIAQINAANDETTNPGQDTLTLSTGCTYTFTAADNYWYGPNALPAISSDIVIEGNGAVLEIGGAPTRLRFFFVGASPTTFVSPGEGTLTLRNMTLRGGIARGGDGSPSNSGGGGGGGGMGGAIFTQGALALDQVTLDGNSAMGGNGTFGGGGAGGGMGSDGNGLDGGGFGGPVTPATGCALGVGGSGDAVGGGGGAGFGCGENGATGTNGGGGGGTPNGMGGQGANLGGGGNGSGGGGASTSTSGYSGGSFGSGGLGDGVGHGGGGGGGVGGGGGGAYYENGGGGGFGGGGGYGYNQSANGGGGGGFGGGGGGGYLGGGSGGFGGGDGGGNYSGGGGAGLGGAIFNHTGTLTITNSTLANNSAAGGAAGDSNSMNGSGLGGAIFNLNGNVTLQYTTIAHNTAAAGTSTGTGGIAEGAGVYALGYDSATVVSSTITLVGSLLANNTGDINTTGIDFYNGQPGTVAGGASNRGTATATFTGPNLVGSSANPTGTFVNAPTLTSGAALDTALAANGATNVPQTLALLTGSTALDVVTRGSNLCRTTVTVDARNLPRGYNANCDLGAFEVQTAAVPAITSVTSTTFTVEQTGTFTVTSSGWPEAVITTTDTLPTGVTLTDNGDGTATLSGAPAAGSGGSYPIILTAANGVAPDATQSFMLTVNQAPAITSATSTSFTVGQTSTFTVTSTGVPTATITSTGTLPGGIILTDNGDSTATLSGTPAAGSIGSYPITLTAANGVAPDATQSFTLTVASNSNNADLSGITLSDGTLSPNFTTGTTSYTATVANSVNALTVTPTVSNTNATVKVNGGSATSAVNLSVGTNLITIVVTAQDGTTKRTYTVTVTRAGVAEVELTQSYSLKKGTSTTAQPSSLAAIANTLTLTITVRNHGPDAVTGIVVADTFPAAAVGTVWTWTCVGTGGGVCGNANGVGNLNETLGLLPKDGSVTFVVTGSLLNPNNWRNTPSVTAPTGVVDTSTANNSATVGAFQTFVPLIER